MYDFLHQNLMAAVPMAVIAYDIIRRLMPTKNPAGFVQDLSKLLKAVEAIGRVGCNMLLEVAAFLDKICPIPQNLKAPVEEQSEDKK